MYIDIMGLTISYTYVDKSISIGGSDVSSACWAIIAIDRESDYIVYICKDYQSVCWLFVLSL